MEVAYRDDTIEAFLARVARVRPTVPAGGSAAALAGALAASLGRFVAALAVSDMGGPSRDGARLHAMVERLRQLQGRCLDLMDADARAYRALVEARRLPPGTTRQRAEADAWEGLVGPPAALARHGLEVMRLGLELMGIGPASARADAGAAAEVAHGCVRAALWIAGANLPHVQEGALRTRQGDLLGLIWAQAEGLFEALRDQLASETPI